MFGDWLIKIKFNYTIKNHEAPPPELAKRPQTATVPSSSGMAEKMARARELFEKVPYDVMPLEDIRRILKEANTNFIDIDFPPVEASIYSPSEPTKPFANKTIVWKRPKEFMKGPIQVFDKKIEPNDIKQG